jgi:hypothetical protein
MADNKPWEEILIKLWQTLVKGKRKYIFLPVFVVFILSSLITQFFTNINPVKQVIENWIKKDVSYLTPDEKDVIDEWVILIHKTNIESQLQVDYEKLNEDYKRSKHENWSENLHKVRNPLNKSEWLIVIDAADGKGSLKEMEKAIEEARFFIAKFPDGTQLKTSNPLNIWMKNASAFEFKKEDFETKYGKIQN